MDVSLLFPSRFLKSAEFKGRDVTLTIASIKLEELAVDGGGTKAKGIVGFAETPKLLVLNRTNSECLKGMWGRETDQWLGKRVTLFPAPFSDSFTGEQSTAIRVRGSPDIAKSTTVEVRLSRKKPIRMQMTRTQAGAKAAPRPQQEPAEEPVPDPKPTPPAA
jgi:hypothetical protein